MSTSVGVVTLAPVRFLRRLARATLLGIWAFLRTAAGRAPTGLELVEVILCMALGPGFLLYLFGWRPLTGGRTNDD